MANRHERRSGKAAKKKDPRVFDKAKAQNPKNTVAGNIVKQSSTMRGKR